MGSLVQLHIGAKAMKFAILTLLLLGVAVARRGGRGPRGPKECSDGSAPTCSDGEPPKEPCSDGADPVRPCDQGKPNTCPDGGRPQSCPRSSWVCCDGSTPVFDGDKSTPPCPAGKPVCDISHC